jgi:hypothetical protein|nr:MAG TPA: replisome organizer [Caudoviricetes sp.]
MTRDEVKEIIMIMTYTYPNYKPTDITATVDTWTAILASYQFEHIRAALHSYILSDTKGFAPTPGQLIDKIPVKSFDMTEMEAWGMVNKALSNSSYHAKEEFEKLPVVVQKTLGRHEVLQEWAGMEIDVVQSVIQSNFIRNYRTVLQREKDRNKLPTRLREILEAAGAKMTDIGTTVNNTNKLLEDIRGQSND